MGQLLFSIHLNLLVIICREHKAFVVSCAAQARSGLEAELAAWGCIRRRGMLGRHTVAADLDTIRAPAPSISFEPAPAAVSLARALC